MIKALLIDDEEHALDLLEILLNQVGDVEMVGKFTNPLKAVEILDSLICHVVFLDMDMPRMLGLEVGKIIREKALDIDIIYVTAYDHYAISAFELEALDYLLKPVGLDRLNQSLNRIRKKRDGKNETQKKFSYQGLEINFDTYTVLKNGKTIELSVKEKQLLLYLVEHPNQVFSLDSLYSTIWGAESYRDTRTVTVHMSNLRKKIEDNPLQPKMIKTVRGFGYRFEME
ncbi:response regulator transcription factor [Ammoniphilus sp. CFH 90114]|uniref:response regulator transcription factor n=1 Tax=Ammoniphilus sp. CFH 90114 TaxID=2493665 RepID=UPI00100FC846|nr:response regulator transcription factor [Ammoniphilus sp. CFH 90114]RXT15447.1 response regulator transcription factor [Ammoniphilus sp. CFH 90114]